MSQVSSLALAPPEVASPLSEGVVELWAVDPAKLRSTRLLKSFLEWLDPDEEARRARFLHARDRHAYLVCRGLVRQVLSMHTGVAPALVRFERNPHGRPELAADLGGDKVRFNLARTRGLAVLAVAKSRPVGIDVEDTTAGGIDEVAQLSFSDHEVAALRTLPLEARHAASYQLWTLKEAYLKARGLGLTAGMDAVTFELDPSGTARPTFQDGITDHAGLWQFSSFRPTPRHRVSVAVRRGTEPDFTFAWRSFPF